MSRPARFTHTVLVASLVLLVASAVFPPMFPVALLASVFAALAFVNVRERV